MTADDGSVLRFSVADFGDCVPLGDPYLARRICPERAMAEIESPCNKVCVVDPAAARCIGCGRSLAEIAGWIGFSPDERRRIMAELPQRLAAQCRAQTERADLT